MLNYIQISSLNVGKNQLYSSNQQGGITMGATDFCHLIEHHDWVTAIRELQDLADEEYGRRDGYSGAINSMDLRNFSVHRPGRRFKSMDDVWDYVEDRFNRMGKNEGEVIDLGVAGHSIAKAVVKEYHGNVNMSPSTLRGIKEPAVLMDRHGVVKASGTMSELKEKGMKLVLKEKFSDDYLIIGKNSSKVFIVTGEGKMVKSTSRKSTANTLVLPYHKYIIYGLAPS